MKYIVEFEDEPCMYEDEVHFYKCIQAPWWGLSEKVIKQLTPYQPEPDCVSRKTALDAFGLSEKTRKYGGDHSGYDTRMLYEIQDTLENLPAVQPDHTADIGKKVSISCGQENDLISRQAAIDALARMMPRSYTPDGSHPADEEIFRAQEVFVDCIEALEILPSAQPDHNADISEINKFIDGLEEILADIRERHVDDSVCGLCEYDGAYMGQSGDWCNECPGFDKDDCFKLSDETRKKWIEEIFNTYPDHTADIGKKVSISCGQENDLISRQAALKELAAYIHLIDKTMGKGFLTDDDCMEAAESVLGEDELPAAQPEIIRCKDCKYMIDIGDDLMCDNAKGWVVATTSDFGCVLAERRTE